MKINGFQHVGIPVTNMATTIKFYTKLGFDISTESGFSLDGATGRMVMMKLNDALLEFYQLPDALLPEIAQRKTGNIDHFCLDVSGVQSLYDKLKAEGFTMLDEAPVFLPFWQNGIKYFKIEGPDHEIIEFCEIL